MRRHLYCRPAKFEDSTIFEEWSRITPNNGFDPDVPKYPSTITWCVYDQHGPLAYMPVQHPLMMESVASRPGASTLEIAAALKEFTQNCVTQSHVRGAGEIYFLGSDSATDWFAEHQMFERVTVPVYRLKLKNLES
jgi:hypothetical protein